jgi:nucleoid-associated protein YgaU
MGLFDELLKSAIGGEAREPEQQSRGLLEGLLELLQDPATGGVSGLAQSFEKKGLGAEATSWIGTGANRSISPGQLVEALGASRVDALGRRAGLGGGSAAAAIAAILPALIDKLTPDGRAPEPARIRELGGSVLASAAPAAPRKADFSNVKAGSSSTAPPPAPQEQWYTVTAGDSLSKIAKRYYGDAQQWRRIYDANREQVKNPDLIHPGQKLRIPDAAQKRD